MSTHLPHLIPGLSCKREFAFLVCPLLGSLIFYFNKGKKLSLIERTLTLISNSESFSPFLPLPGGRPSALWLTAAPPSVCRPSTYSADKHSRAWGVPPADTAVACMSHTARQRDKRVQPGQMGPHILSRQMQGAAELHGSVMRESVRAKMPAPARAGIYPPPNEGHFVFCVFLFMQVSHTQTI